MMGIFSRPRVASFIGTKIFKLKAKWIWGVGFFFVILLSLLTYCVNAMLAYPASTTQISPSGRYIMENVRVGKIFMFGGMAYLRVIDTQEPEKIYRTPLYDTQSLDMRAIEYGDTVGIYWIHFNRKSKEFIFSIPQWEESWLNIFISNTAYTYVEN